MWCDDKEMRNLENAIQTLTLLKGPNLLENVWDEDMVFEAMD